MDVQVKPVYGVQINHRAWTDYVGPFATYDEALEWFKDHDLDLFAEKPEPDVSVVQLKAKNDVSWVTPWSP